MKDATVEGVLHGRLDRDRTHYGFDWRVDVEIDISGLECDNKRISRLTISEPEIQIDQRLDIQGLKD
jgi:hypothetical protein